MIMKLSTLVEELLLGTCGAIIPPRVWIISLSYNQSWDNTILSVFLDSNSLLSQRPSPCNLKWLMRDKKSQEKTYFSDVYTTGGP